ncbi:MAG: ribosome silencing factor [Clostridia bacterium]
MNDTIKAQVDALCEVLYHKKAFDILPIHVADKTVIADWFIIASGRVPSQVKALCDEVEDKAPEYGLTLIRTEGYTEGRWIVLDYGHILVHLFHPEERQYYSVERLWDEHSETAYYDRVRDAAEDKA